MDTPWNGIVVRCNTNESGNVPRSTSTNSPDIILAGKIPFENPSFLTDPRNYNNYYANSLYVGLPNYLYVRGKNFTAAPLSGTWNLFYATPNILLYPYLWETNKLVTSSGEPNPAFTINPGEIGASTDAFTWVPADTSDQYSMIAVANTPGRGNPLAGVTNITSLAEVLANNANIAQRNVQMVRGALPQVVSHASYDQGSEGFLMDIVARFTNIPKGSSCTVGSGTPVDGRTLYYSIPNSQNNDFQIGWPNLNVPAYWKTVFTYTLTFGRDWSGIPSGAIPTVDIFGLINLPSTDRLYHLGRDADPDPVTGRPRLDEAGQPVRVLLAGSIKTIAPDVVPPKAD
jgi:hypothetical protein